MAKNNYQPDNSQSGKPNISDRLFQSGGKQPALPKSEEHTRKLLAEFEKIHGKGSVKSTLSKLMPLLVLVFLCITVLDLYESAQFGSLRHNKGVGFAGIPDSLNIGVDAMVADSSADYKPPLPMDGVRIVCLVGHDTPALNGVGNSLARTADKPWIYTMSLPENTPVAISVEGEICAGTGWEKSGPEGIKNTNQLNKAVKIEKEFPFAALLYRLSNAEKWQTCDPENLILINPTVNSIVEFMVNDADQEDNSGAFAIRLIPALLQTENMKE